ncbi:MAG TPA: DUF2092 domain-containing protein [Planctomycetota bacterium]|nr:DUF2092 domain-containing protein [Planctomycetota bacterium]
MKRIPLFSCLFAMSVAFGAEPKPDDASAKLDSKAIAILRSALEYLNGAQTYSTTLTNTVALDGGPNKKKETTAKYDIYVERPNKLALIVKDGNLRCAVVSDGKTLCAFAPPLKKYAVKEAPKDLAEIFNIGEMRLVREDLSNLLFLDQVTMKDALDILMDGVQTLSITGVEPLGDVKAHHLHFTQADIDWDMWIQEGKQPLVRKVSIEGEQMMSDKDGPVKVKKTIVTTFDDWKINAPIPSERFVFTPPQDTTKVPAIVKEMPNPMTLVGKAAPPVKLKALDGGMVDLASFKGKNVVVLDFWATWCGPCRMAMPVISEVTASYKDKGLIAYAVNLGEDQEKVGQFKNATPTLTMPILLDEKTEIAEAYKIASIPMTVIIDKDGVIQRIHMDVPKDMEKLRAMLKQEFDTVVGGGSLLPKEEKK